MTTTDIMQAARDRAAVTNAARRAARLRDDVDRVSANLRFVWS